jgi:putative transcriptional regulator
MMAKRKRNVGREILAGLREMKRGETGRVINVPKVSFIREKTGLSQARFASVLGVSVRTLQDWEQGRRAPSGAARTPRRSTSSLDKTERLRWPFLQAKKGTSAMRCIIFFFWSQRFRFLPPKPVPLLICSRVATRFPTRSDKNFLEC